MFRRKCASATFLTLGKSGNKTCRRYHGGANALTFCCLSDGFRIGFGPVRKSLGALRLVRDYIPTSPPVFPLVPEFVEIRQLCP
jgi:hypothetical protein